MPSLFRFLFVISLLVGLVYGSFYVLATFFEPEQKQVVKPVTGVQIK
ncbi:MAG: hypothetical protein AAGF32_03955 [Pseudomonadota bacterium]